MPQQPQQNGAFDIQSGPFTQYLDPTASVAAPRWDQGQQPSGFEHKTGVIADLNSKLLQGITNGRVRAYAEKERRRLQTWDKVTAQYTAVQNDPDVDPQIKAQIRQQYYQMLGSVGQEQLKDSKSTKDKGVRGQIAGVLNSVFEKLSGGPIKGDALTVEKMADFMGTVSKAVQSGTSASTAYQKQFDLIQQGIDAAKKNMQGKWTVPTQEQILSQPQTRQALAWFQQYAPSQMPLATQLLQGYPSQTNIKERASSELTSGVGAPPSTGARSVVQAGAPPQTTPPTQQPVAAGYTANKYPAGPPTSAAPPQTTTKTPAQQEEDEWQSQLAQWAGVQQDVPIFNSDGEIVGYGPKATAAAIAANNREINLTKRQAITEADKKDQAKQRQENWEKTQARLTKQFNDNFTEKERSQARADAALAYRKSHDATVLAQAKTSEEKALNDFVADATANGHTFGVVADNIEDYLDKYGPDTEIGKNKAYIIGQVAAIKNKQAGGNWMSFFGGGAPPSTAKPATSAAPPKTAPPKTPTPQKGPAVYVGPGANDPEIRKQLDAISKAIE